MVQSRCGILCSECEYKENVKCRGCLEIAKPFWTDTGCPVKQCCEEKHLVHCGLCEDFPCSMLHDFAYSKDEGDNGARIDNCRCWAEEE